MTRRASRWPPQKTGIGCARCCADMRLDDNYALLQAGMFMWMALGAGVKDADEILDLCAEARVVFVPGEHFPRSEL